MIVIRTKYVTNASGKGQIRATGEGRQRTVSYDHSLSHDANHGKAAGTLALALGLRWDDGIEHEDIGGGVHLFAWTPPVLIRQAKEDAGL